MLSKLVDNCQERIPGESWRTPAMEGIWELRFMDVNPMKLSCLGLKAIRAAAEVAHR